MEQSLYFLSYAIMSTLSFVIIFFANYMRMREGGSSIPKGVFKIILSITIVMWMGFVGTIIYYS